MVEILTWCLSQGPDSVDFENEKWQDVNVVSSLLKLFFRRMSESLVTEGEYSTAHPSATCADTC